jgi:GNAT superfamily N-acetyltransferase
VGERLGHAIQRQFETFCRTLVHGPGVESEPGFWRLVTGEPHPLGNYAVVSDATDPEPIRRAIEPLCKIEAPSAAIFPGAVSDEIEAFVGERGYALTESMPAMAVDLDKAARPGLAAGHEFLEIDPEAHREAWNDALAAGYDLPRPVAERFGPGIPLRGPADGTIRYFAVTKDGTMVATSTLFLEGGLAGIYCVSTLPDHRGKGLGAYATAEPLHLVREEGYRVGILQSSAMGESVYRSLGFEQHGVLALYVRPPLPSGG